MPDTCDPITPDNAAMIFIDLAEGPLRAVGSSDVRALRANAGVLAEAAAVLGLPTVLAEAAIPGPGGVFLPEITSHHPTAVRVPHATNNSWGTPAFERAVRETGRSHLVMAGVATDVGLALTAISAVGSGFTVYAVVDASGTLTAQAEQAAWLRMARAGVILTSWAAVIGEIQGDYTTERGHSLRAIIGRRLGSSQVGPFSNLLSVTEPGAIPMHDGHVISRADAEALVSRIHAADNALDLSAFLALLDPNVRLRLGSQPPLEGTEAVRVAIAGLFAQLAGIRHRLIELGVQGNAVTFEAEITYAVADGRTVTLPYVDVLRVGGDGLITEYRIYIDLAPLFALLAR